MTSLSQDYEINSMLGTASMGFDIPFSKNVAFSLFGRYHHVLSSRESQNINNLALYGNQNQNMGYQYGYVNPYQNYMAIPDSDKQSVGGSMAQKGFYSVMAGLTFTF